MAFLLAVDHPRPTQTTPRPNLQAGGRRFEPGTLHLRERLEKVEVEGRISASSAGRFQREGRRSGDIPHTQTRAALCGLLCSYGVGSHVGRFRLVRQPQERMRRCSFTSPGNSPTRARTAFAGRSASSRSGSRRLARSFKGFYGFADGGGGVALIEADSAATISRTTAPWAPWLRFTSTPIVPIEESSAIAGEAVAFRDSVS